MGKSSIIEAGLRIKGGRINNQPILGREGKAQQAGEPTQRVGVVLRGRRKPQ